MTVYFDGTFSDKENVSVSPDDRGFLLADGVYEVICAYEGELFEAQAHYDRLLRSLQAIELTSENGEVPKEVDVLPDVLPELIRRNGLDERHAKLYLQVTRGVAPRQHAFPDASVPPTVYATARPYDLPREKWKEGVRVIRHQDLRGARCDVKSIALLPAVLANQEAKDAGVFETVLVREGVVTEGSHTTVAAVTDGTLVTHPLTHRVLPGITRRVVLDLCAEMEQPVKERPIREGELESLDEVMLLGTTSGVMPVVQVDDQTIGEGTPGPITRRLQDAFLARTGAL